MPNKPEKPPETSGDRVKKLIDMYNKESPGEKITQFSLAEDLKIHYNAFNAKLNGKRTLTLNDAKAIANKFPGTRYQWIMLEDDFRTEGERLAHAFEKVKHEGNLLYTGLWSFAVLADYKIIPPILNNIDSPENHLKAIKGGYKIEKDDQMVSLSLEEMNRFENEVFDFVELKLKHLFKEKGDVNNGQHSRTQK